MTKYISAEQVQEFNKINYLNQALTNETKNWINSNLANHLNKKGNKENVTEIEHIIDYLNSSEAPKRLKKMSYSQANNNANKWMKSQIKKGNQIDETQTDIEPFIKCDKGFVFVKLIGENAYKREGHLMRHCVASYYGSYSTSIYSLRDKNNNPHATIEVSYKNDKVIQMKGKGNGSIHPNYIKFILVFLKELQLEVKSYELRNLGYFKIEEKEYNNLCDVEGLKFFEYKEDQYIFIHSKPSEKKR